MIYVARPNLQRLEELKQYFPPHLQRFADNFFTTCEPFTDEANYYNYMSDIDSYAQTAKVYRQYRGRLRKLFSEVIYGHRQRWEMPKELRCSSSPQE